MTEPELCHLFGHTVDITLWSRVTLVESLLKIRDFGIQETRDISYAAQRRLTFFGRFNRLHCQRRNDRELPSGPGRADIPEVRLADAPVHQRLQALARENVGYRLWFAPEIRDVDCVELGQPCIYVGVPIRTTRGAVIAEPVLRGPGVVDFVDFFGKLRVIVVNEFAGNCVDSVGVAE